MRQRLQTKKSKSYSVLLLCIVHLVLGGCGADSSNQSDSNTWNKSNDSSLTNPGVVGEQTEVVVISTQHFLSDMPEGYTPGHLRALLAKVSPDALAVEAPTNVPEPMTLAPYELGNVTVPWATGNKIKVVPCGWSDPAYPMQIGNMIQEYQARGSAGQYQQLERELQLSFATQPMTCEFMNSPACHQRWRDYHKGLHELCGKDTPWEELNAKILMNVRQTLRKHAGQRVAIIFGGAHSHYFLDQLENDSNVKLVFVEQFFPLTEKEVAEQTQPVDYLKALRPLNFRTVTNAQLAQAKPFLEKVKAVPELSADYLLFHGQYLLHEGKPEEALLDFQELTNYPRDTLSRFDEKSRVAELAHVYSALALIKAGDTNAAQQQLSDVMDDPNVSQSTRQWASQIQDGITSQ